MFEMSSACRRARISREFNARDDNTNDTYYFPNWTRLKLTDETIAQLHIWRKSTQRPETTFLRNKSQTGARGKMWRQTLRISSIKAAFIIDTQSWRIFVLKRTFPPGKIGKIGENSTRARFLRPFAANEFSTRSGRVVKRNNKAFFAE